MLRFLLRLLSVLVLTGCALGQNQYGPDYILMRAVNTDPYANPNFGQLPRPGLAPPFSPLGAVTMYFDNAAGCIKASINGGAYACLGGGGSTAFSSITAGSNTNVLTMGTGGSLSPLNLGQVATSQEWFQLGVAQPTFTQQNTGGTLLNSHTIAVQLTFNSATGETLPGPEGTFAIAATCTGTNQCTVTVASPVRPTGYTGYTVYSCDRTAAPGCSVARQNASAACVNITGSCVIGTVGAGIAVPTANTAFLTPPFTVSEKRCSSGGLPVFSYLPLHDGTFAEQMCADNTTAVLGNILDRLDFTRPVLMDDTSTPNGFPQIKQAFLSISHLVGKSSGVPFEGASIIDPAIGYVLDNTGITYSTGPEQYLGMYSEVYNHSNSFICTPIGDENCAAAARLTFIDTRTSGSLSGGAGHAIVAIEGVARDQNTQASPYSSCVVCLIGIRGHVSLQNTGAVSQGGAFFVGLAGSATATSGTSASGQSIRAFAPTGFSTSNIDLFLETVGAGANDWNLFSVGVSGTPTSSRNFFGGNVYLPNILSNGAGTITVSGSLAPTSVANQQFATWSPGAGITISNQGTPGATSYTYRVVAKDATGGGQPETTTHTTNTGAATLTGVNFNRITLNSAAQSLPASCYDVYRTASSGTPSSTGKIGSVCPVSTAVAITLSLTSLTFDDTGLAGDGTAFPTVNTTGGESTPGYAGQSFNTRRVASDFTSVANTNLQTITGLSWTTPPGAANYSFHCSLTYSQGTAAAAMQFGIQVANVAPTNVNAKGRVDISTSTQTSGVLNGLTTTTATSIVTFTPSASATVFGADLDGSAELPAGENVLNIMVQTSNSADLPTVKRGSYCYLY